MNGPENLDLNGKNGETRGKIHLWLSPADQQLKTSQLDKDTCCVVIDVLRATTTIVTALAYGAAYIEPVCEIEEALKRKAQEPSILLAGERNGKKISIEGIDFDFGNSPLEFCDSKIAARGIVMTTTNGTKAFVACKRAGIVVACALVNLKATAKFLLHTNYRKFILVAAGTKDETALEDVYTAGALIHRMLEEKAFLLTDAAILAYQLYQKFGPNAYEVFKISQNGVHLIKIGLEDDLYFAARMDRFETVPILQNGRLV